MNIEEFRQYCISKKEVTEHFPFDNDALVFKVCNKMFAITSLQRWEEGKAFISLKCEPNYAEELRATYSSVKPGYHLSKKHWNSIYLHEAELPHKLLMDLIDHSYNEVVKGLPKKDRERLLPK